MAIMMILDWPGATIEQYEAVRKDVNFETDQPAGLLYHVIASDANGLRIVDTWESAEQFQSFMEGRILPAVQKAGITAEPRFEVLPAHNIFSPAR
jgi:hypothetical protein